MDFLIGHRQWFFFIFNPLIGFHICIYTSFQLAIIAPIYIYLIIFFAECQVKKSSASLQFSTGFPVPGKLGREDRVGRLRKWCRLRITPRAGRQTPSRFELYAILWVSQPLRKLYVMGYEILASSLLNRTGAPCGLRFWARRRTKAGLARRKDRWVREGCRSTHRKDHLELFKIS